MNRRIIWIPVLLALTAIAGIWIGKNLNFTNSPLAYHQEDLKEQKIRQIIKFIDYEYVDDVNTDSLLDLTISELLHKLDPHSSYISVSDVQRSEESIQGSFEGIGIEFTTMNDSLTVLRVIEGGPSDKAGLKAGDRILKVDNDSIAGMRLKNSQYVALLKGPAGSQVTTSIYRPYLKEKNSYTITRGTIPLPSVDMSFMLIDKVGVIKVNRFAETTLDEFDRALRQLMNDGMEKLILDLRDNPGGLLFSANQMAEAFLEKGDLIVYTEDRHKKKEYSHAEKDGIFTNGELVVLINENSASASEIVAGALQDNDRATIIGRRSFGKGLVQEEMELKDGSRIRLTTSRYFTPTGRSIQRSYGNGYDSYRKDASERYHSGELFEEDSIKVDGEQEFITPGGRKVYGGGGIVPDIFVPIDTSSVGVLYHYFSMNRIDNFAFYHVDKNRKEFIDLDLQTFIDEFVVDEQLFNEYLIFNSLQKHAEYLDEGMKDYIKVRIKALLARNIFGSEGFYVVISEVDPMITKSLSVLNSDASDE